MMAERFERVMVVRMMMMILLLQSLPQLFSQKPFVFFFFPPSNFFLPPSHLFYSSSKYYISTSPERWTPFQYYSSSCYETYGQRSNDDVMWGREDVALCSSQHTNTLPTSGLFFFVFFVIVFAIKIKVLVITFMKILLPFGFLLFFYVKTIPSL